MIELWISRLVIGGIAFFAATILAMLLTWCAVHWLPRWGLVDHPGGRHVHKEAVPRGGGVAVILTVYLLLGALSLYSQDQHYPAMLTGSAGPAALLLVTGLIDDRRGMKAFHKLLLQLLAGAMVWYFFGHRIVICGWQLPMILEALIFILWVVAVINSFNLIDGLDGIAAGLAFISGLCLAGWFFLARGGVDWAQGVIMLIFAGSCLGFLRFNFHPAKIFLGDTGSMFLGLFLSVAGLRSMDRVVTVTSFILPLLMVGVPFFDMLLAIWRRMVRKLVNHGQGGIMTADQDHLHHRLLRQVGTQNKTAWVMYLICLVFISLGLTVSLIQDLAPGLAYLLMLVVVLGMLRRLAMIELFDSATLLRTNFSTPRKSLLFSVFHPVFDLLILLAVSGFASLFLFNGINFNYLVFSATALMLALFLGDTYRVYWFRAGIYCYAKLLSIILIASCLVAVGSVLYCCYCCPAANLRIRHFTAIAVLQVALNCSLILLERFILHYFESLWYHRFELFRDNCRRTKVMIFGGGLFCRLYLQYFNCLSNVHREHPVEVVGIIDDDQVLQGLYVYGCRVLGGSNRLEDIYAKHPFEKLVITSTSLGSERERELRDFCRRHGLDCTRFVVAEEPAGGGKSENELD